MLLNHECLQMKKLGFANFTHVIESQYMSLHVNAQLLQVLIKLLGLQKYAQLLSYRGAQHIKDSPNVNSMEACRTNPNMPNIGRCPTYQGAQLLRFQCNKVRLH